MLQAMVQRGYQVGNNVVGLRGHIMHPTAPGQPWVPPRHEVQVLDDRIRVFTTQFFGIPYTRASYLDTVTVQVFATIADFLNWCRTCGTPSEPGQPAFSNAWD